MRTTDKSGLIPIYLVIVLLLALHIGASDVQANGAPVTIYLSYLPDVSNWGPRDATGVASVAVGDGEIFLELQGLPRLEGEHYHAWLECRLERRMYSLGPFNATAEGETRLHVVLDTLPYQEYRMLIISVEENADTGTEPSERRSVGGYFPNLAIVFVADGTPGMSTGSPLLPGPAAASTGVQGPRRPEFLPTTGSPMRALSLTLVGISVVMLAAGLHLRVAREEERP